MAKQNETLEDRLKAGYVYEIDSNDRTQMVVTNTEGVRYEVELTDNPYCSCPAFILCKHIRDGWTLKNVRVRDARTTAGA
jgi:hypothetical protein